MRALQSVTNAHTQARTAKAHAGKSKAAAQASRPAPRANAAKDRRPRPADAGRGTEGGLCAAQPRNVTRAAQMDAAPNRAEPMR